MDCAIKRLHAINTILYKLQKAVLVFLFSIMIFAITLNVILRYVYHNTIFWVTELACYMLVYLIFIGSSMALYDDKHVRIQFDPKKINEATKKVLKIVSLIIIYIFIGLLIIFGSYLAWENRHSFPGTVSISMGAVYLAVPISGIMMFFEHTEHFLLFLRRQ